MAEIVVVLVVVGLIAGALALVAWPALRRRSEERPPPAEREPAVTDRGPIPPRSPDEPIPGSRPDRERRGRP